MSYIKYLKNISPIEQVLAILFIVFIVMPIDTPDFMSNMIDTPFGMIAIFIMALYLFTCTNPIIAILFIFVSYELIRRSSKATGKSAIIKHTPTQQNKDIKMEKMNPPKVETLEQEIVNKMAPIGHSDLSVFSASSYSPIFDDIGSASLI
jgi:predicted membrane protein